jgi:hypothetical protein
VRRIADEVLDLPRRVAAGIPGFDERRGPGKNAGDGITKTFLTALDDEVMRRWPGAVERQKRVIPDAGFTFDYFVEREQTAVEIALSVRNPLSEFEKDAFKAILAQEAGLALRRLVLIGKKGAVARLSAPGPQAIIRWLDQHHAIEVLVEDLE